LKALTTALQMLGIGHAHDIDSFVGWDSHKLPWGWDRKKGPVGKPGDA